MAEHENLQIVTDAYDAISRGDIQSVMEHLTDDVAWELPGPEQIPYAGSFHGKSGASEFFRRLAESDEVQAFEPKRFFADGDMVVVLGHYTARVRTTGQTADADWVHVFTLRGGKVSSWREYFDTASYAQAYAPSPALRG